LIFINRNTPIYINPSVFITYKNVAIIMDTSSRSDITSIVYNYKTITNEYNNYREFKHFND